MKRLSTYILILFCLKAYSQNNSIIPSQIKNKDLKAQIAEQEKISQEILEILDSENKVQKYLSEKAHKEAQQFRKEQNLKDDHPVQIAGPRLTHQDSVALKLDNQDALLYKKYEDYSKIYQYIEKLSKDDKALRERFYDENLKIVDDKYKEFYQNKKRNKSKFEKLALYTTNFNLPVLIKCETDVDPKKCFSTIFRNEIERQYQIEEYIFYDTNIIKTKILFRITKEGIYEPLEIAESSGSFFVDMNALQIAKKLFTDKKIAKQQDEDFYSKIPLSFSFEGGR
ncbi:hypothetical protein ATE47_16545 [Chryseobacterium sp. IHB B 17019]|jgi:hypothetical protein|uniref:hypothetical protein n=1 Tax=Chryseobacterium sp. IHB B 17019 TaxID=1721091 RepID=UPI0007209F5A|nr:hypothetical protein [Chryseobacterium sp. IHB B 17019]ALR32029.1 hypothetical protein ATE47_16545 [Chryseobacterium sp. IHB B 17019]